MKTEMKENLQKEGNALYTCRNAGSEHKERDK